MSTTKRRRFRKAFAKYKDYIKAAAAGVDAEIFQKLACWLGMMDAWYDQMPVLMDLSLLKDAVSQHIVPLAAWVLRPHLGPLLGRVMPPPDPPDAVLRDQDLQKLYQKMSAGYPQVRPEAAETSDSTAPVAPMPPIPLPMARWLRENSKSDTENCGSQDRVPSDTGTLDYSTDEEDLDLSSPVGVHPILAPVLA